MQFSVYVITKFSAKNLSRDSATVESLDNKQKQEPEFIHTLTYISPDYSEHVQIGGIYTLYSHSIYLSVFYFYFNFPTPYQAQNEDDDNGVLTKKQKLRIFMPIPIRITLSNYEQIESILNWVKQQEHLDAEYIIHKMKRHSAFLICATLVPASRTELLASTRIDKSVRGNLPVLRFNRQDPTKMTSVIKPFLQNYKEAGHTSKVKAVEEKYQSLISEFESQNRDVFGSVTAT